MSKVEKLEPKEKIAALFYLIKISSNFHNMECKRHHSIRKRADELLQVSKLGDKACVRRAEYPNVDIRFLDSTNYDRS